jgi:hypothetical protein
MLKWPKAPVYLLMFSILLFLVPASLEGPVLFDFQGASALSLTDLVAVIPLMISVIWIQKGLWRRRIYLFNRVTLYPGATTLLVFSMGLGLGMVLAHAFSTFRYWWAIGGASFIIILAIIVWKSGRSEKN